VSDPDVPRPPEALKQEWPGPLRKARIVLLGLWRAAHDFNVAYKMGASAVVLVLAGVAGEWLDLAVVAVATGMLLMSELFNTALEQLCDFVESGYDERIGAVKDVAAAAAGTAMVFWLAVVIIVAIRVLEKLL
jgi:diacylglycerol kinase